MLRTHSVISSADLAAGLGSGELVPQHLHLGLEIVEHVQQQRLGGHRQLGRAELVLAVMAQNHVLHQHAQLFGKRSQLFHLLDAAFPGRC